MHNQSPAGLIAALLRVFTSESQFVEFFGGLHRLSLTWAVLDHWATPLIAVIAAAVSAASSSLEANPLVLLLVLLLVVFLFASRRRGSAGRDVADEAREENDPGGSGPTSKYEEGLRAGVRIALEEAQKKELAAPKHPQDSSSRREGRKKTAKKAGKIPDS